MNIAQKYETAQLDYTTGC